jgi:hypothetical protein
MNTDLVHALRIRGVDVTTALEQGMIRLDDADHLELASTQGRALYSFNMRDYQGLNIEYLSEGKHHGGIILAQQQRYSMGTDEAGSFTSLPPLTGRPAKTSDAPSHHPKRLLNILGNILGVLRLGAALVVSRTPI